MLKITGLTKSYKDKSIFRSANFEASPGELTLLYGASGLGKSTLLEIIAGLTPFQSGTYLWKKEDLSKANDDIMSAFRGDIIGYIPQDFALIGDYTVLENLILPSLYHSEKSRVEMEKRANQLAKHLGIAELLSQKAKQISGGQKQRVAIARALVGEYDLILADEPTANLDNNNFTLIVELLQEQKEAGRTVIIATHDDRLRNVADKIYMIRQEKLYLE